MQSESIDVSYEMNILKNLMEEKQLKVTPQRLELAEWIFQVHEHFTVDDVLESFKQKGRKISTATVYRMIQMMQDLNLVIRHDFGTGQSKYEHTPGHPHHDHIICNNCGCVFEFSDDELEAYKSNIARAHNFRMTSHSLNIYGDCLKENCENSK